VGRAVAGDTTCMYDFIPEVVYTFMLCSIYIYIYYKITFLVLRAQTHEEVIFFLFYFRSQPDGCYIF